MFLFSFPHVILHLAGHRDVDAFRMNATFDRRRQPVACRKFRQCGRLPAAEFAIVMGMFAEGVVIFGESLRTRFFPHSGLCFFAHSEFVRQHQLFGAGLESYFEKRIDCIMCSMTG